jgi:hypothetical protein
MGQRSSTEPVRFSRHALGRVLRTLCQPFLRHHGITLAQTSATAGVEVTEFGGTDDATVLSHAREIIRVVLTHQ